MPSHDSALPRLAQRHGKERGRRVYVPAETLQIAGIDPDADPLRYRFYPGQRGRIILQFERVKPDA